MNSYVETIAGGCLGRYDPAKDEAGLIREGFETWRGHDACTAANGRYVVVTTVPWPQNQGNREVVLTDPHGLVNTQADRLSRTAEDRRPVPLTRLAAPAE